MQNNNLKTLSGFLDLTPQKQFLFNKMKRQAEEIFALNGLTPMDTPILEYSEVLLAKAGGETEKQIYRFMKGDTDLSMRFDLTVPFAKYCGLHANEMVFPFKRYQIGKVFRGERPQKGRLREFVQCDIDIISEETLPLFADAECIDIVSQVYAKWGYKVVIRVGNRKLLNGMLKHFNLENNASAVFNILDKKDKVGKEITLQNLSEFTKNGEEILKIIETPDIDELKKLKIETPEFLEGIGELEEVFNITKNILRTKNLVKMDLSVIRGLDYYTGTVFEANLLDLCESVSVGGGGRYAGLANKYSTKNLVGVGVSVGLSRVFDLLDKANLLPLKETTTTVLAVIPLGDTLKDCSEISMYFKQNHIPSEVVYLDKAFKHKLNYANRKNIPYIMVVGENEVQTKVFGLKNMATGNVVEGSLDEIISLILNRKI